MPNLPKENWLLEVYDLSSKNELDKAADILFDKVDDLLLAGDFKGCDSLLTQIDLDRLDVNLVVAALAITFAAKHELPSRTAFVTRSRTRLLKEFETRRVEALVGKRS
jgi:hypothetical protein